MTRPVGVLFVCLGNICRSPLAEAIFVHQARARGVAGRFRVDSAGLGRWHEGERADPRSIAVGAARGVEVLSVARQIRPPDDFDAFDWQIAMDRANVEGLTRAGAAPERIRLMLSFGPSGVVEVPDPYTGTARDFERVFELLEPACAGLLEWLLDHREHAGTIGE